VLLENGGMLFMPPFSSQHHAVLETIPCDDTEPRARHLYQLIQTKARSQICSSRTTHHANLRGRLLPATDAGVAFVVISAHLLGQRKRPQQAVAGPLFIRDLSFRISAQLLCRSRICFFALSRFGFHPPFMFHRDAFGF